VSGNFVTQPSLSAATAYYLGFETDSNSLQFYGDASGGGYVTSYVTQSFGTFPSTITGPANWGAYQFGLLVNYGAATGTPSAPPPTGSGLGHNSGATADGGGDRGLMILNQAGYAGVSATGVSMSALVSNSDSAPHNVQLGMYTKSGSTYTLVANTSSIGVAAGATKSWVSGNFVTQPSLSAATAYYLGFETDSNSLQFYGDASGGGYVTSYASQPFGTFPSTITGPPNWGAYQFGLLVNYGAATGSPTGSSLGHNSGATGDGGGDRGLTILNQAGYTGVSAIGVSMSALVSNSDSAPHNVQLGMYTKSGSTYTLVASTGFISVAPGTTKAWVSGNFVTRPSLSTATTYYLGFETDSNGLQFYGDSSGGGYVTSYVTQSFGTFPSTITGPANWGAYQFALLVNY
jgi:hypothetical protein